MRNSHSHFGIYGCIKKDNSILLIKKARGPYKGMYDLPGGSPEANETNEETFTREIKEETGLDVTSYTKLTDRVISNFYEYSLNKEDFLLKHSALFYMANQYVGNIKTTPDGEDSCGAKWINTGDLYQVNCSPLVKTLISRFGCQIGIAE
jgi:8-oxo-dGTP diphosphatase